LRRRHTQYYAIIQEKCQVCDQFFDKISQRDKTIIKMNKNLDNTKYLIFDFDGVIADSLDSMAYALKRSLKRFSLLPLPIIKRLIVQYVDKPVHSHKENLSEESKVKIVAEYQDISRVLVAHNRTLVFEGFIAELRKLIEIKNCRLAIVSSGSELYIHSVAHKIDLPFEHVYGCETSLSKENKVAMVCQLWEIENQDCMYFTDSKTDVMELRHILDLSQIIGCSWGWQGEKKLKEILPENQIRKEFSDVKKVV
jgi:phosphoglycolate phosphatase-like HAD superfamily hydrolase